MVNGYELNYLNIVSRLKDCDFEETAKRLGLVLLSNGSLSVDFLGRRYIINKEGVEPADGKPVNVNNRSILVFYATSKGQGTPVYSYSQLRSLSQGLQSGSQDNLKWMTSPLIQEFGGNCKKFCEAMDILGAVRDLSQHTYEYAWVYSILPKIPCQIIYYEADEELPCEVKIMFDKGALRFLEFEQLAFLSGCFVKALTMIGRTGSLTGWPNEV